MNASQPDPGADAQRTLWGHVHALGDPADLAAWEAAWQHLVDRYRPYFLAIARRRLGRVRGLGDVDANAEEVVDAFLARCVDSDLLSRADPERGRFRAFVGTVLGRFTKDWITARLAQKRMPSGGLASIDDELGPEPMDGGDAVALDQAWATLLLEDALVRLDDRSVTNATVMRIYVQTGRLDDEALAAAVGKRPEQMKVIVHRARGMFAEELWEALKQTVSDEVALEQERVLFQPYLAGYLDRDKHPSFFGGAAV